MTLTTVTLPGPTGTPVPLSAWGTPMTNNVNELITDITPPITAWTAYTPAWTSTGSAPVVGNGTIAGRFMQFGKLGFFNGELLTGTTTTYGTGAYRFSFPVGWSLAGSMISVPVRCGGAIVTDTSVTTTFAGQLAQVTTTTFAINTHAAVASISGTVPMTFATGDTIQWSGIVELT